MKQRNYILNVFCSIIFFAVFFADLFCLADTQPSDLRENFQRANAYYGQENYKLAIDEYQKLVNAGLQSGNLYYNLGNAYFRLGELGKAILNYKRAERLMPKDTDLIANLKYANSFMDKGAFIKERRNIITRFLLLISRGWSTDAFTKQVLRLYLALFLAAALFLMLNLLRRPIIRNILVGVSVLFLISLFSLFAKIHYENQPWAIVISKAESARFEPFENATVHFEVFRGQPVIILKTKGSWSLIKRNDGKFGWVNSNSVERL